MNKEINKKKIIVVGLGNPGEKYEGTRHNVGFHVLDSLVDESSWIESGGAQAVFAKGYVEGREVEFLKPLTMMNRSGQSVKFLMGKYNLEPEDILVVHDDLDLEVGKFKISFDRGAAGHNGVKSVINAIESHYFGRIRIGVSPTDEEGNLRKPKQEEKEKFVLRKFSKGEQEKIDKVTEEVINAIAVYVGKGREEAMNKFN